MIRFFADLTIKSTFVSFALFFLFWFSLSFSTLDSNMAALAAFLGVKMLSPFISGGTALWLVMRD